MKKEINDELMRGYEASKTHKFAREEWMTKEWEDMRVSTKFGRVKDTGVDISILKSIGEKITTLPDDWNFHP